jgi:hypothetical protein
MIVFRFLAPCISACVPTFRWKTLRPSSEFTLVLIMETVCPAEILVNIQNTTKEFVIIRYDVTVVKISMLVSWVVMSCELVGSYRCFEETFCLRLRG